MVLATTDLDVYDPRTTRRDWLRYWLQASITDEEAASMASGGFRSLPCGSCAKYRCPYCKLERPETVMGGRGGRRIARDSRAVRTVIGRLSRFPRDVFLHAQPAFRQLEPPHRIVLSLGASGLNDDAIGRHLKISRSTVLRLRDQAFAAWERAVWPPQEGQPS